MDIDFAKALSEEQKSYFKEFNECYSRFRAFKDFFNIFEKDQTVIQLACGSILEDIFHTKEKIKGGKIILIEPDKEFVYNRAVKVLGEGVLKEKKFYTETNEGKDFLRDLFKQANIEVYISQVPPFPLEIKDDSINHIMAINAAFEIESSARFEGVRELVLQINKKLKDKGSFAVQGLEAEDLRPFSIATLSGTDFLGDIGSLCYPQDRAFGGYWARWIKMIS